MSFLAIRLLILCTKRALNIYKSSDFCVPVSGLPDHFIRLEEQCWGNREPKRLGDLEADDTCERDRPLHRPVGQRDTFQELVHGWRVLVSPYTSSVPCTREVLQRRRRAPRRTPRRGRLPHRVTTNPERPTTQHGRLDSVSRSSPAPSVLSRHGAG